MNYTSKETLLLVDWYKRSIKCHLDEIERPNGVIANYMISIVKSLEHKNHDKQDIINQIYNYAWDLTPWLKDPYPAKLFEVFEYYKRYKRLDSKEKKTFKTLMRKKENL